MPKAHLTALVAALALGTVAPRLAAQDTSSAAQARPDTSGYTAGGGVDTSAGPGRAGAIDTIYLGADSASQGPRVGQESPLKPQQPLPRLRDSAAPPPSPTDAPGHVDASDTTGPLGATDTSAMCGRHADTTRVGDTTHARPIPCPAGNRSGTPQSSRMRPTRGSADSAGVPQPTTQPPQSPSGTAQAGDSAR
jgi:hypothetical protein